MFRHLCVASAFALSMLVVPGTANAGHDASAYHYAVFPEGHWIGHGTLTVTHAGSLASAEEDGSFSFDLRIVKGVASGTMAEEMSGTVNSSRAVAKIEGLSAGNGYTLSGNAGRVLVIGAMNFTGTITGAGRTIPIRTSFPVNGRFAPDEWSCAEASGNLVLPAAMNASSDTTMSGPWTAINVAPGGANTKAQAAQWFVTVDSVNEDVAKIKAGEMTLTAAQARALIEKAQVVIAGFASAERCQGGSHVSAYGESFLKEFEANEKYLETQLKLGDFKS